MAIEGITGKSNAQVAGSARPKSEAEGMSSVVSKLPQKTDSIAITDVAQAVKKALESSSSATLIDMERVAAVKAALADGTYEIHAEKIAAKMIQHEKLMHGHGNLKK